MHFISTLDGSGTYSEHSLYTKTTSVVVMNNGKSTVIDNVNHTSISLVSAGIQRMTAFHRLLRKAKLLICSIYLKIRGITMLIALVIIAAVLGMKFNDVIHTPWWVVVIGCFFTLFVGLIISGRLKFRVERVGE